MGRNRRALECLTDFLGEDSGSNPTSLSFVIIVEGQLWAEPARLESSVLGSQPNQYSTKMLFISDTRENSPVPGMGANERASRKASIPTCQFPDMAQCVGLEITQTLLIEASKDKTASERDVKNENRFP